MLSGTPQKQAAGGIGAHILDALLKAFGGHGLQRQPDPMEGHQGAMEQNDQEDFGPETAPMGLHGSAPTTGAGKPTAEINHPQLKMLMAKLSPTQEEEPDESGEFSPGRMESGFS